jgi:hypothetical protein
MDTDETWHREDETSTQSEEMLRLQEGWEGICERGREKGKGRSGTYFA